MILASIPSPGFDSIGPFRIYGLMIALGVLAAVWVSQKRWADRGGDPDDISAIAIVAVPAGLVGARLYHVITDWRRFEDDWLEVFNVRAGGLGIPGGAALGILAALWVMRRRGMDAPSLFDAMMPTLPLAQAIGRLGNWFNQELFGRPTDLPWALEIDVEHRPAGYESVETFHPTFLYESLWNLALFGILVVVTNRRLLRPGYVLGAYVLGYSLGRLWIELLRIDPATELFDVRVNVWVSLVGIVGGAIVVFLGWRGRPGGPLADLPPHDDDTEGDETEGDDAEGEAEGDDRDVMAPMAADGDLDEV